MAQRDIKLLGMLKVPQEVDARLYGAVVHANLAPYTLFRNTLD